MKRRIAVMRIPLYAVSRATLRGLGLNPGDAGYDAVIASQTPQAIQSLNSNELNYLANNRYQDNFRIYQVALSNWQLNEQQRQSYGLPPAPMPIAPNPADYVTVDPGVNNTYIAPRGPDTVQTAGYGGSYTPPVYAPIPQFQILDPSQATAGGTLEVALANEREAARHAGNLATQQASIYASQNQSQQAVDAQARAAAAIAQQTADQMKQATARAQDTANAQRLSQQTFARFVADQQVQQRVRAVAQATQNAAASSVVGPNTTTPFSSSLYTKSASGSGSGQSTLQQLEQQYLSANPSDAGSAGTIIGNGSVLGPLTAPAASFLPASVSSALPNWAQSIPLWGALAGVAGLGYVIYDHTGKRTRR